eukprot:Blabericola_migrator_1__4941@NODE_2577_length_2583_cov_141_400636_g1614_i0_p2_GENE_NODE_2577_length_2583_cov_141_400636_g1614_i0NODE_2577_length_2583_cov_141_400636_g1614_i0_p2_ORF_typecomplete_len160_score8_30_NODE_2577_length_2583_cov_141_400636_g1614_i016092088
MQHSRQPSGLGWEHVPRISSKQWPSAPTPIKRRNPKIQQQCAPSKVLDYLFPSWGTKNEDCFATVDDMPDLNALGHTLPKYTFHHYAGGWHARHKLNTNVFVAPQWHKGEKCMQYMIHSFVSQIILTFLCDRGNRVCRWRATAFSQLRVMPRSLRLMNY